MGRQARSLVMARRSAAALLAAVEMGNKTLIPYREETFCLQLLNAWEILLKARIVQQNRNRLESIFEKRSGHFVRDPHTQLPYTIKFMEALKQVSIHENVRDNLLGVNAMRNEVAHIGILSREFKENVLRYGSASIINFGKLYQDWFHKPIEIPYLVPIAFVGKAEIVALNKGDIRQRQLLNYLSQLVGSADTSDINYSVSLNLTVSLNPIFEGGGTIRVINDPNALQVRISDDQVTEKYPWTYKDLISECKRRYVDFKMDDVFHELMRQIKNDGNCAYERKLDPKNTKTTSQWRYKSETALELLDTKYDQLP